MRKPQVSSLLSVARRFFQRARVGNGGLGDWALAQSGVSYTISFYDSDKSSKSSSDTFGIRIVYTSVAPQPLKGGDIKVQ